MKNYRRLALVLIALWASRAGAAQLAYEPMNYSVGSLPLNQPVNATGFTGNWFFSVAPAELAQVASGSLGYGDAQSPTAYLGTQANRMQHGHGTLLENLDTSVAGPFSLAGYRDPISGMIGNNGTTLYMSVLLKNAAQANPAGFAAFEMFRNTSNDSGRTVSIDIWSGHPDVGTGYDVTTWSPTNVVNQSAPLITADVNTHLFVLKIVFGATGTDTVSVYADPNLDAEPGTATGTVTSSDLSFDRVGIGNFGFTNTITEDEIRVGSTYADVVPEPSSLGLCLVGSLALLRRRR